MDVRRVVVGLSLLAATSFGAAAQPALRGEQVLNQATSFAVITPSDTIRLRSPTKGIYIGDGAACDVALMGAQDSSATTFTDIAVGVTLPLSVIQVMGTNTTCTSIIGLW